MSASAAETGPTPSGTVRRSTTVNPRPTSVASSAAPEPSCLTPAWTDSETVSTLAWRSIAVTLYLAWPLATTTTVAGTGYQGS